MTDILEDFALGELVGEGSTAHVHRATHVLTGVEVALKVWRTPSGNLDQDARQRFARECRTLHDLSRRTDRVVHYLWSGLAGGYPWLAMDLHQTSLAAAAAPGPLPVDEVLDIADDVLVALTEIHGSGHLHRDLKPANVLLRNGRAVVSDFGISLAVGRWTTDLGAGTRGFVAPELATGALPSPRTDLYSMGCTLLAALPPDLPSRLEAVLTRVTSHDPDDRPGDAASLRRALAAVRATPTPAPSLRVTVAGLARTLHPGQTCVIGRGDACELVVPDPRVSRRHATIAHDPTGWTITDLDSANGLWLDGRRVPSVVLDGRTTTVRLGGPDGVALALGLAATQP